MIQNWATELLYHIEHKSYFRWTVEHINLFQSIQCHPKIERKSLIFQLGHFLNSV